LIGATFTGAINLFKLNATLTIDAIPDPRSSNAPIGQILCEDGLILEAPTLVLKSSNPILSLPGGQIGAPVIVAGVNSLGESQLGYSNPIPVSFTQQDTHTANVVIKAANAAVAPTTWILLNLDFVLTQSFDAGKGTMYFKMQLSNPTSRTGVVEFGLNVNGVWYNRDIAQNIPAYDNSIYSWSVPLLQGYNATDQIALGARVISNSNNQFSLTMLASSGSPAVMRLDVLGQTSSGGGDMYKSVYDPQNKSGDAFNYANFNGLMAKVQIDKYYTERVFQFEIDGDNLTRDLIFPNQPMFAVIKLKLTGRPMTGYVTGEIEKTFYSYFFADGAGSSSSFVNNLGGDISTRCGIGEMQWSAANGWFFIPISAVQNTAGANWYSLHMTVLDVMLEVEPFAGVYVGEQYSFLGAVLSPGYVKTSGVSQLNGRLNITAGTEDYCMAIYGGQSGGLYMQNLLMLDAHISGNIVALFVNGAADGFGLAIRAAADGQGYILKLSNYINVQKFIFYGNGDSLFEGNLTAADFILNSDIKLKENIKPIEAAGIDNIDFIQFNFIADKDGRIRYGVIAQQVKEFLPAVISENQAGELSVSYIDLLCAKIDSLEKRVKKLENGNS
jgi:hypothetical protein